jgi:hypothetical protein
MFRIIYFSYLNAILSKKYIKYFDKITAKLIVKKYRILIFNSTRSYMLNQFT